LPQIGWTGALLMVVGCGLSAMAAAFMPFIILDITKSKEGKKL